MDDKTMNGLVVVAKKGTRFFTGGIKNGKFVRYREIKKLSALKNRDNYVTLAAYLKSLGGKAKAETVLANLKLDRLYIRQAEAKSPPVSAQSVPDMSGMTERAWEKVWWASFHPVCVPCKKSCKQSSMLLGVHCPHRTTK